MNWTVQWWRSNGCPTTEHTTRAVRLPTDETMTHHVNTTDAARYSMYRFLQQFKRIWKSVDISDEVTNYKLFSWLHWHIRCVTAAVFKLFWLRTPILLRHSWRTATLVTVKFTAKYSNSWAHCGLQKTNIVNYIQITMEGNVSVMDVLASLCA